MRCENVCLVHFLICLGIQEGDGALASVDKLMIYDRAIHLAAAVGLAHNTKTVFTAHKAHQIVLQSILGCVAFNGG